ncbi:MAG: hypothetical protein AB7O97_01260 [Planctomycetota bacterium]
MWTYVLRHHEWLRSIYARSEPLPPAADWLEPPVVVEAVGAGRN